MENTRFLCNSLWVFRYESVKINYVSKGKPWDYEFLWFCAFVFCGNLLQPCFILWIDINCKWDLHNKRALDNITNWVNVIASLKWWEDALRCIYYYYWSWAHCLSPFSFLMTSTEFERQTLLPLETFNLINCFFFLFIVDVPCRNHSLRYSLSALLILVSVALGLLSRHVRFTRQFH